MTSMLLQQELMEPEPQRRLIVRHGMTAHWGVDPSTQRISIAWASRNGADVRTHPFPRTEGLARLGDIYESTAEFVQDLLYDWPAPGFVLVEQPSGKTINLELTYAVGTIITALIRGLEGVRVETVVSSSWKKVACGRGDIYKPKKGDDWEYGVLRWARENGYGGSSWDEADALGIAEAARRMVTLEAR